MNLSTKLIADYNELASQYLDSIPVEKEEDFASIREALMSITKPDEEHKVIDSLKNRVKNINDIINEPEIYVQDPKHYGEFKNIIIQRVAAKIREFDSLNNDGKAKYIQDQKMMKNEATENRSKMSQSKPPAEGSEAHVISMQQWLVEQQSQFQNQVSFSPQQILLLQDLLQDFTQQVEQIKIKLDQIQNSPPSLGNMFLMQMEMNRYSQLQLAIQQIETVLNRR